jgi:hypothetical protein
LREQSLSAPAPGDRVGALNENKSIGGLPRTVIQLGDEAKSTDQRDWALRELNDYGPDDELPPYRTLTAPAVLAAKGFGAERMEVVRGFRSRRSWAGDIRGRDALIALWTGVAEEGSSLSFDLHDVLANEEHAVVLANVT